MDDDKVKFATIGTLPAEAGAWPDWPTGSDCDGVMCLTEHEYKAAQKLVNARLKFQRALYSPHEHLGHELVALDEAMQETTITYHMIESMYFDQCRRTDYFAKLAEEVGDEALRARIVELEGIVVGLNARVAELNGGLPLMKMAFRTTQSLTGEDSKRQYKMVFEFNSLDDLQSADSEWHKYRGQ